MNMNLTEIVMYITSSGDIILQVRLPKYYKKYIIFTTWKKKDLENYLGFLFMIIPQPKKKIILVGSKNVNINVTKENTDSIEN